MTKSSHKKCTIFLFFPKAHHCELTKSAVKANVYKVTLKSCLGEHKQKLKEAVKKR